MGQRGWRSATRPDYRESNEENVFQALARDVSNAAPSGSIITQPESVQPRFVLDDATSEETTKAAYLRKLKDDGGHSFALVVCLKTD